MAEKPSSSQESPPLSQETYRLLLNENLDAFNSIIADTPNFQDLLNNIPNEVLEENKTLKDKLGEMCLALEEEKAKFKHLSMLNSEMKATNLDLEEKLRRSEINAKQQLEQVKLFMEIKLKEALNEKKKEIDKLQQEVAEKELKLNETCLMYYEEAAKVQALKKWQEIESKPFDIQYLNSKIAKQAQVHKKRDFNEEEDLNSFGDLPPVEPIEDFLRTQEKCITNTALSSLPAIDSWPGDFDFRVFFSSQENAKAQWVYSSQNNKLYVKKDSPCPINFSTNNPMFEDFYIRTMPFFSSSDHVLDKVHRCVNHSMEEIQLNKPEAEHLVRVESINAYYDCEQITGRHSVVVPFENPPAGQKFSSYIFKFACFQSCSGGPNRRPLMLRFTLENRRGVVVGRKKVHLKICACPFRDFKMDEKLLLNSSGNQIQKKGLKRAAVEEPCDTTQNEGQICDKKPVKIRPGPYFLKVEDRRSYDILKFFAKVYLYKSNEPLHKSTLINLIRSTYSSSEEEDKK